MAKNLIFQFLGKNDVTKMAKNCQKIIFFKKAYDKVEISTQGTLTPNFNLIGIDPTEKSCL